MRCDGVIYIQIIVSQHRIDTHIKVFCRLVGVVRPEDVAEDTVLVREPDRFLVEIRLEELNFICAELLNEYLG